MRRGVVRCAGAPTSQEVAWLAAQLAAGDDHVLGRLTAARICGFRRYPVPPAIDLVTASTSRARLDGVRTHRTAALPSSDVTRRGALPVTTPARTLVDTCGDVPFGVLRAAANDALRRSTRTIDIVRCVDALPMRGRRATRSARLLVATLVPGYDPGESEPEVEIVETLAAAGYPRPEQQVVVRGRGWRYRIDVGYPDLKQGFEYQSEEHHLNRESFHNDPLRTIRLQRAGWTIWPITSRTGRGEILLIAATIFGRRAA